jgi:hypothetical protein
LTFREAEIIFFFLRRLKSVFKREIWNLARILEEKQLSKKSRLSDQAKYSGKPFLILKGHYLCDIAKSHLIDLPDIFPFPNIHSGKFKPLLWSEPC